MKPEPALVARFEGDLEKLIGGRPEKLGIAVSGGPDSLALLLLATAAYAGRVAAATIDHGLRKESTDEARMVAGVCAQLGIPHEILAPGWRTAPSSNVPALARDARYAALADWAERNRAAWVATAHHADDQAETFLMRLARGSGVAGLAGVRAVNPLHGATIVRPLLGWRKAELVAIVEAAGLKPIQDPTNDDERLDRTHARRLLEAAPWLDPDRIGAVAATLLDVEESLAWTLDRLAETRLAKSTDETSVTIDPNGLPRELTRRLLLRALAHFTDESAIPGPKLMALLDRLQDGETGTLAGVKVEAGDKWRLTFAPPRRS